MVQQNQEMTVWFEKEVKSFDTKLRAYLSQNEPEPADVDDIMQESYRRILEVRQRQLIRSPQGLLFKIAKNVSNERLRRKYRSNTYSIAEIDNLSVLASEENSLEQIEKADNVALLETAMRSLPRRCRTVMILRNYHNLSYKQIAEKLDISVDTVETQLSRGLKKIKKHFKSKGYSFE